jgi:hypothetical protein
MQEEITSLHNRKVWKLVDLPPGRKTVKCRWTYTVKSDGRKKSRLVAKGFTQIFGIDFEETFSPVARFETVRLILALAALEDWEIEALDVKTAFYTENSTKKSTWINLKVSSRRVKREKSVGYSARSMASDKQQSSGTRLYTNRS